jgi:hypothetical protein
MKNVRQRTFPSDRPRHAMQNRKPSQDEETPRSHVAPMNDAAAQNRNTGANEFCATSVIDEERLPCMYS